MTCASEARRRSAKPRCACQRLTAWWRVISFALLDRRMVAIRRLPGAGRARAAETVRHDEKSARPPPRGRLSSPARAPWPRPRTSKRGRQPRWPRHSARAPLTAGNATASRTRGRYVPEPCQPLVSTGECPMARAATRGDEAGKRAARYIARRRRAPAGAGGQATVGPHRATYTAAQGASGAGHAGGNSRLRQQSEHNQRQPRNTQELPTHDVRHVG